MRISKKYTQHQTKEQRYGFIIVHINKKVIKDLWVLSLNSLLKIEFQQWHKKDAAS